jgi:TonB-dependent Receptor Plug Domain/CarboxypepD_reg-like domain
MTKTLLFFATFLLCTVQGFSQKQFTLSGFLEDSASGEKLIAAAVFDAETGAGAVSNTYGFYSLTLPKGKHRLLITYVGYEGQVLEVDLKQDLTQDFQLRSKADLKTVEISTSRQNRIENRVQMSQVSIPIEQIKKIPALMGEVDVLKALQLLPGVQAGGEGQNGLYIRGGSPDQNLILLDGVPVYNVSHLGGFFSVFNADAIKNVTLTKGGFPARYGGRLSSVIEIDMKEGNNKELHGEGGIGILSSRLTLEGPIVKDKASFMISGRRTYLDLLLSPIVAASVSSSNQQTGRDDEAGLRLYFYDLNAKVNYKLNDAHRLFASAYLGSDVFGVNTKSKLKSSPDYTKIEGGTDWGNVTTALRWNWIINNKLFANTTATYSQYQFSALSGIQEQLGREFNSIKAQYTSGISDWAIKSDFDYSGFVNTRFRFGAGATHHTYNPGAFQVQAKTATTNIDTVVGNPQRTYAVEPYIYAEAERQFGALKANVGLHASGFAVDNQFYSYVQPRLGLNYLLNNSVAIKASFAYMAQYINLLANESFALPTDLWVPSTARIKPQLSSQVALGIAKTIRDDYEFSVEGYYKNMDNVLSYREGSNFLGTQNSWQDKVTQGNGRAYGVEVFLQKKTGRTTGWIGYTLSWNNRQFADINQGNEYPFRYDRRHDISVVVSHQFTKKFSVSIAWIFGTGNAISLPETVYEGRNGNGIANSNFYNTDNFFGTEKYQINGEKNAYRMPNLHRLDINFEFKERVRIFKKYYEEKWYFGAYNAYNRANPYAVYLDSKSYVENGQFYTQTVFRQLSIFPVIPFVSYGFKF